MSHDHHSDRLARELLVADAVRRLRALLPTVEGEKWEVQADSVRNQWGLACAFHASYPKYLAWMAAADPATIALLLDALEGARAPDSGSE